MKTINIILVAFLVALPLPALAESFLSDRSVKYIGEPEAKGVCRAVVEDDLLDLDRRLSRYKNRLTFGYSHRTIDRAIYASFTCNEKDILNFADEIGANTVSGYLRGGKVTVEEYISSIN